MKGNSDFHTCTQSQDGMLHQETHMLLMKHMCKDTPDVIAVILTQLLVNPGLKEWGTDAMQSPAKMKTLHFTRSCKAERWNKLTPEQKAQVLELHHFTKKNTEDTAGPAKATSS
jgi:hypothetical protein